MQRSLQFARFLPEHGFEPVIVAGPLQGHNRWEPQDDSLQANLPANTPIYRPETPAPPVGRAARIDRLLARHNAKFRWWRAEVLELGRRAAREHDVALVYVSMSPSSGLEPALSLGSELGLPVVADLRDPWALDEAHPYLTAVHKRRELAYMRTHLPRADRILMNTPEAGRVTRAALAVGGPEGNQQGRVRISQIVLGVNFFGQIRLALALEEVPGQHRKA